MTDLLFLGLLPHSFFPRDPLAKVRVFLGRLFRLDDGTAGSGAGLVLAEQGVCHGCAATRRSVGITTDRNFHRTLRTVFLW